MFLIYLNSLILLIGFELNLSITFLKAIFKSNIKRGKSGKKYPIGRIGLTKRLGGMCIAIKVT